MTSMAQHIDQVLARASDPGAAARSRLAASWRRSLDHHGLDPGQRSGVRRVTQAVLDERLERSEGMLRIATPKIDALFQMVGSSGCGVLLTDDRGVVLDLRASAGDREAFDSWGLAPGADWSEASEGTNGIGTCIAEGRQVIIHRGDHFHARNTAMSCMDAPIFGPEGDLIGALDVSSARADQTEAFNQLIAAMVAQTARQIEADTFRATFPEARIIVVDAAPQVGLGGGTGAQDSAMLLAVDGDDIVRGATRGARRAFR
ncbi:MAG: GAF domain-containing protein, partial [Pseudomonadota bacterium]|nr:GAF domain-containing protein [Pseudomonadota bacterium]